MTTRKTTTKKKKTPTKCKPATHVILPLPEAAHELPPAVLIPFPAAHFEEPITAVEKLPEPVSPPPSSYRVACKVDSVGFYFWKGTLFVALSAVDGQDLQDLLCVDQKVVLEYKRG